MKMCASYFSILNLIIFRGLGSIFLLVSLFVWSSVATADLNPYSANNTLYPSSAEYVGSFRTSNYDYPVGLIPPPPKYPSITPKFDPYGAGRLPAKPLTTASAENYVKYVRGFITPAVEGAINDPQNWTPAKVGWYDMIWNANGSRLPSGDIDPKSGREALLGSFIGQILPPTTFREYTDKKGNKIAPPTEYFQNHAVIYYNDTAAGLLGRIWEDPFDPNITDTQYPTGSVAVKIEFVTLDGGQWGAMENSFGPPVFRPTVKSQLAKYRKQDKDKKPEDNNATIVNTTFSQLVVKVKDPVASPNTGWVFMVFAYDKDVPGNIPDTVWDRATAVGAMWGNDPEYTKSPGGPGSNPELQETWINPEAPGYTFNALGWGKRLSGPMDVGTRHNVVTVSGTSYPCHLPSDGSASTDCPSFRASSCLSCHGSSQFPFVANLYPSPNLVFPQDGEEEFLFYDPATPEWMQWFQNRSGREAMSGSGRKGIIATDYDMLLTFSLMAANAAAGGNDFILHHMPGH